jgi:citrate lyase subunit beta / citryl-CoA lyase
LPGLPPLRERDHEGTRHAVTPGRKGGGGAAKAEAEGLGAVTFDGVMIDAASVRIIRNVIDKANLIGM